MGRSAGRRAARYAGRNAGRSACGWALGSLVIILSLLTPAEGSSGEQPEPAESINVEEAMATYGTMTEWIRAWETPSEHAMPAGSGGVWIGLRWGGRLMGRDSHVETILESTPSPRTLTAPMRGAMSRAREAAVGRDGDAIERARRAERFQEVPSALEVQFALEPKRIRGATAAGLAEQVRPGLDGVLLRLDGEMHAIFPAEMMLQEQGPGGALETFGFEHDLSGAELNARLADGRIRAWRFAVLHLAQASPDDPPMVLHRGSRVVPLSAIDQAELESFAANLAEHLEGRLWPGEQPLGLMGTYLADVDRFDPLTARGADQALAAYALARYAAVRDQRRPDRARRAREAAWRIMNELAARVHVDDRVAPAAPAAGPIDSMGTAAMILLALDRLEGTGELTAEVASLRQIAMNAVRAAWDAESESFAEYVSPPERAACALALESREAVDVLWRETPFDMQPSLLPWIGLAELRLAGSDGEIKSATGLRGLRTRLWETQITGIDSSRRDPATRGAYDLVGALPLEGEALPDWSAARPVAFLAAMLRDERLTTSADGELMREIVNLTRAMRFLRQLSIREADRYRLPDPERAMHGVRGSLLSDRLPPAASAMTLVALAELLASFDAIENRLADANAEPRSTNSGSNR